MLMFLT